jgi:hypothetical protein
MAKPTGNGRPAIEQCNANIARCEFLMQMYPIRTPEEIEAERQIQQQRLDNAYREAVMRLEKLKFERAMNPRY